MEREVELDELGAVLSTFEYPIDAGTVIDRHGDLTLVLADGEADLASVLGTSGEERFDSASELETAIRSDLPRRAVGEPYQSEGEG